ncbi:hypothetical protein VTN96DRAFT_8598 [Rasamsonia emersonii]|uniref:DNA-directed RNA polymerase III subunit RPC6 n=1 Tax=Rasamsonia emersonii (strain ATCC 16479 / CBS 393.64 / IMI 116815) TaxID=1408163 RepID=A0A0F4YSP5_RASE3|nr:DNA-directed RNA polymerase [Rasamsonia emersonii CBS 393.64]KKA20876.1 DNA-directed RNA polymerase [Rasamsonia emersonii CBS 393.64]
MAAAGGSSRGAAALASELYEKCRSKYSEDHLIYQQDLLSLGVIPNNDLNLLLECTQSLVDQKLFRTHQDKDDRLAWKLISQKDAERLQNLSPNESLIYDVIHSTGRAGIWIRPLKARTNLHKSIIDRCLKSLESKNYIKSVQNVRFPGRKVYMLAELTPSEDVTGGAWFTDGVLDAEFINVLSDFIEHYVSKRSWYEVPTSRTDKHHAKRQKVSGGDVKSDSEKQYLPFPAGYQHYPTVKDITAEVNKVGITPVTLNDESVAQLLDMLCYDNKLVALNNGLNYKAVKKPNNVRLASKTRGEGDTAVANEQFEAWLGRNGMVEAPCGQCPVFKLCQPGGAVSPENCEYFDSWLEKALGF